MHGTNTLEVEITNVGKQGIWVWINGKEFFLDYDHYPWFKEVPVSQIMNVRLLHSHHLYWPDLDVDLEIDTLRHPKEYSLIFK